MNQQDRDRAIQQAINSNPDPAVAAALMQYQRTGVPPSDPAAIAALTTAVRALGLAPDPAVAGAAQAAQAQAQGGDPSDPYAPAQAAANQTAATTPGGVNYAQAGNTASNTGAPSVNGDPGREANRTAATPAPGAGLPTAVVPGVPAAGAGGGATTTPTPGLPGGNNAVNSVLNGNDSQQLREALRMIGIDPDNLGLSGGAIAKQMLPFLQSFVKTDGLLPGSGNPTDNIANRLNQFAGMFNSDKGFYGQLQDYGQQLVGGIGDKLAANNDVGMQKMYLDMINNLTNAGGNALTVSTAKQMGDKAIGAFGDAELDAARTGTPRPNNYVKWLQGQSNPQFSDIIKLVTGGR